VPTLWTEAFFPCHDQKVYAKQTSCKGTVSNHCEEFFESNTEKFPTQELLSSLISPGCVAWLPKLLPCLWRTHNQCTRSFFFLDSAFLFKHVVQTKNSVPCRCPWVWKMTKNFLSVAVTATLALCSIISQVWSASALNWLIHSSNCVCSSLVTYPGTTPYKCEIGMTYKERVSFYCLHKCVNYSCATL